VVVVPGLVESLRARDYDIATIRRAAETVARGQDRLLLYLSEYAYWLDIDRLDEAALAVEKAEGVLC
jgi:hypothetical protein